MKKWSIFTKTRTNNGIKLLYKTKGGKHMITKDMIISDILTARKEAAQILMSNGMGCLGCPSSQMETLEQAAEIHGLDVEKLIKELNE